MSGAWWLLVAGSPVLALLALLGWRQRAAPWLWLATLPALVATLWPPATLPLSWLWPGAAWGIEDGLGRAFLGLTGLLWSVAAVFAASSERGHPRLLRFWVFWQLSLAGNLLLVIALDGASFYVGFTLMSLSAYGLVVHKGGPGPRQAGRLYLQLAVLGEMLLYAGLMVRVHESGGAMALAHWQNVPVGSVTLVLLVIGFGIKAGFWPLHIWLPLAHPAAPAAASAVLSGAMIKAGILGLWHFLPVDDPLLRSWSETLLPVALASIFFGVLVGLVQTRAKTVLAYSSVSQAGYLLAIVAVAWSDPQGRPLSALLLGLYVVHHGFAKGALFLGAGLAAVQRLRWYHWLLMGIPALALAGLPLSSGAAVKVLLKDSVGDSAFAHWLPLLTLGSVATAVLVWRAMWLMYRSQPIEFIQATKPGLLYPWVVLSLLPVLLPWLWPPLRSHQLATLAIDTSVSLIWPLAVALALVAVAVTYRRRLPVAALPHIHPGRYLSLRLKRLLQRPPLPPLEAEIKEHRWRRRERRWNRFWQQGTVVVSAWLLCLLLVFAWLG